MLNDIAARLQSLRALDTLQLASAIRLQTRTNIDGFATSDRTLAKVAKRESFAAIIPEQA